jgi:signal transduction histidine kinase
MSADIAKAREHVTALIAAARAGAKVDVGQLEVLARMLDQVEIDRTRASAGMDLRAILTDTAEFWKTAIHELRTPMTSIRGYSDMLAKPEMGGQLAEMQQKLLGVVRNNSRRMESLLADFSIMNKLRASALQLKPKLDTVKNIAMMVEKRIEPTVSELGRKLIVNVPSGLPMLQTDGEHLSMALAKLVENGLRYSSAENGKVELTAQQDGTHIQIIVSDNGIGMAPEDIAKLGRPYFRADHEVVRAYKGSGLGVPIAYSLMAALGGTINVDSTPGKGTRWIVRLPAMGVR